MAVAEAPIYPSLMTPSRRRKGAERIGGDLQDRQTTASLKEETAIGSLRFGAKTATQADRQTSWQSALLSHRQHGAPPGAAAA
jgi:hypothetical protein